MLSPACTVSCFYILSGQAAQQLQAFLFNVSCMGFPYGVYFMPTLVSEIYGGGTPGYSEAGECSCQLWITLAAVLCLWNKTDRKLPKFICRLNLKEMLFKLLVVPSLSRVFGGPTVSNWWPVGQIWLTDAFSLAVLVVCKNRNYFLTFLNECIFI